MTYRCIEKIKLTRSEFERYKKLFQVDLDELDENGDLTPEMEKLVDESDYREDTMVVGFCWLFENNVAITVDICCGQINAYDNCVLYDNVKIINDRSDTNFSWTGNEAYVFDCDYDIRESMEFVYGDDSYICEFEIVEDDDEES